MYSVCPECERLAYVEDLYCRHCGASMKGAKLVQEVKPPRTEPKEEQLQTYTFKFRYGLRNRVYLPAVMRTAPQ